MEGDGAPPAFSMPPPAPGRHAEADVRVAIVDDAPEVRRLLAVGLGARAGLRVVGEAADGASGVALVREHDPEVVIVDLGLPDIDGLELVRMLRVVRPALGIVVHSGDDGEGTVARATAAGADAVVVKGAGLGALSAAVDQAVRVRARS